MRDETKAIHIPTNRLQGAVSPPIQLSTTYEHGPAGEDLHGLIYIRDGNPNVADLQARLAAIEDADGAVAFGSGMAAAAAVLCAQKPGSRIIFHQSLCFDMQTLSRQILPNWGLHCESVDLNDATARSQAFDRGVDLVWLESPSNPLMEVLDIATICEEATECGAEVLVDGTFATPVVQKPLNLGATYVMHSLTKYMGGHSDVQGGAIAYQGAPSTSGSLLATRRLTGGVLAPFNAWLISRGLQTLHCRMERHCANALSIARALEELPSVERVRYPHLQSHPQFDVARRQMSHGGGMLSFQVAGGKNAAIRVVSRVKLFVSATSLGGC